MMADRGFTIADMLDIRGHIEYSTDKGDDQLTPSELQLGELPT